MTTRTRTRVEPTELIAAAQPLVSCDVVARCVAEIRLVSRDATLRVACDIGQIVVTRIFAGDIAALRDRGDRDASFRKLAAQPHLPMSAATLWRAVQVYEFSLRFPAAFASEHLLATHLYQLAGLPEDVQERLLRLTLDKHLTPHELGTAAARHRVKKGAGGRPPLPAMLKSVRSVSSFSGVAEESVASLSPEEAIEVREIVRSIRRKCDALEPLLARRIEEAERLRPTRVFHAETLDDNDSS